MKRVIVGVGAVFCFVLTAGFMALAIAFAPVDPDPGPGPGPGPDPDPLVGLAEQVDEALDKDRVPRDQRDRLAGVFDAAADLMSTRYAPKTSTTLFNTLDVAEDIVEYKRGNANFVKVLKDSSEANGLAKEGVRLEGQTRDVAVAFLKDIAKGAAQ